MDTVAPPRPSQIGDPLEDPSYEALIEEARLRARRRRWMYGGMAVVVVVAALALVSNNGGTPGTEGASARAADPPPRMAAVMDPDAESDLVASWGQLGVAWVLLYGDGRVLQQMDLGATILERHLSPVGWDGVRSGAIDLEDFVGGYDPDVRESDWWVDPSGDTYAASAYAICPSVVVPPPTYVTVAAPTAVVDHLPPGIQSPLRGTERTFTNTPLLPGGKASPVECWEVTSEQADTLIQTFEAPDSGFFFQPHTEAPWIVAFQLSAPNGPDLLLTFEPLLPHGEWILPGD